MSSDKAELQTDTDKITKEIEEVVFEYNTKTKTLIKTIMTKDV
tara:strand:+ start:5297 stop:5425 length:129 start_codon:yes stop_codon:yes gene_type:complete